VNKWQQLSQIIGNTSLLLNGAINILNFSSVPTTDVAFSRLSSVVRKLGITSTIATMKTWGMRRYG
jgi:hypothetical protein